MEKDKTKKDKEKHGAKDFIKSAKGKIILGVIGGIIIIGTALAIILPIALDKDLHAASAYPSMYNNLKEEKKAFSSALNLCNARAQKKINSYHDGSYGRNRNYNQTDPEALKTMVDEEKQHIIFYDVAPTDDNGKVQYYSDYKYTCATNKEGTAVIEVSINKLWD